MKFAVPRGACDTHMHFYDRARSAKPGTPNAGHFSVPMYGELQARLGLERVVVVKPDAPEEELERLTRGGMCAVRIMMLHGGTPVFDVKDEVAARYTASAGT